MKKGIVVAVIITAMIIVGVFLGLPYTVKKLEEPKNSEITGGITDFRYSVGSWTACEYELEREGDKAHLTVNRYKGSDVEIIDIMVDADCLTELSKIINDNEIYKWNGFDKSDDDIMDGEGFSLSVAYDDGKKIEAHGYMKFPSGYKEGASRLTEYLERLCTEDNSDSASDAASESSAEDETEDVTEDEPDTEPVLTESEELYQAFINDEIPAIRIWEDGTEDTFMYSDLPHDGEWDNVTVSDKKVDLDNDGENELILTGANGGMYLDARDGKVYVLAEGEGTALYLCYAEHEGSIYVVHCDTIHSGRCAYNFDRYNGKGEIEDSFQLAALYWDSESGSYDENSKFICRDENITMEEYEALRDEVIR